MTDLKHFRKLAARPRAGGFLALFLVAGLLALVTPLRAQNLTTYLFEIDSSAVPRGFEPTSLALGSGNNVYVTDYKNNRMVKFSETYPTQWGNEGSAAGQFDGPQGIAVDSSTVK